ncbi:ATP-binding protein [Bacillus sp. Marseille-P3661]|uniref:ATP-binding protein n=1 Tax=Bacillus sp. Marseille-P3661 TaxID=1936234 RepID=UPI000C858AB8|nr:sensor histidine kinase [Bacillus sp. Marseille-P3661]
MKEILINVLFLLVVLLVTQHILEVYTKRLTKKVVMIYAFFAGLISIFFCMTFPFHVSHGFNIDIRIVPFIIASLYGGPLTSFGLYIFIVFYRFILGVDLVLYGVVLNYALIPIFIYFIHKHYLKSGIKNKILMSLGFVFFHILTSHFIYSHLIVSNTPVNILMLGAFIKVWCIVLIILTIERIRLNFEIRNRLLDIEKMEIISHLSASISHEIRNGLTGAKGFMQLLKEGEHDSQKKRYIGIAMEELERSEGIIRDFLTFAKPAPEKVENINMEELISYTIELIKPLANMHSIIIQRELSIFWIQGDRRIIQQAFLNILKNAVEAMPDGGDLLISVHIDEQTFKVSFKDTGVGMSPEQIERLGKPYFTTKGQKGTGLGMMVAYRVIQELNGEIKVNSKVGKGTTFTILLPRICNKSYEEVVS